jgi:hypothetical protein
MEMSGTNRHKGICSILLEGKSDISLLFFFRNAECRMPGSALES